VANPTVGDFDTILATNGSLTGTFGKVTGLIEPEGTFPPGWTFAYQPSYGSNYAALSAAETLAEDGISAEVIDLRSLRPLDMDTVLESAKKTGRALIVHEGWKRYGAGAEIAASIMENAFDDLDAPIETENVGARLLHQRQQSRHGGAEEDGRSSSRLDGGHHSGEVRKAEDLEIARRKLAAPGIEDLDHLRACRDLHLQIRDQGLGQLLEQLVRQARLLKEKATRTILPPIASERAPAQPS